MPARGMPATQEQNECMETFKFAKSILPARVASSKAMVSKVWPSRPPSASATSRASKDLPRSCAWNAAQQQRKWLKTH
eukprot:1157463-Pelagomonas_calceolata.AAC.3